MGNSADQGNKRMAPEVSLNSSTWHKNSFGLFDYESKEIYKQHMMFKGDMKLVREEEPSKIPEIVEVKTPFSEPDTPIGDITHQVGRLFYDEDSYWFYHKNQLQLNIEDNLEQRLWNIVRFADKSQPAEIEKGSIIKIGRVLLRVKDIDNFKHRARVAAGRDSVNTSVQGGQSRRSNLQAASINPADKKPDDDKEVFEVVDTQDLNQDGMVGDQIDLNQTANSNQASCRYCCSADSTEENPLISPCNCVGSIRFVHLLCLKTWLETKRKLRLHRGQVVIKYKKVDCEICKETYPFTISHQGKLMDIISIDRPESNFIVLEYILKPEQNSRYQRIYFILNTEDKDQVLLGRGGECDVRIAEDVSVSRKHAMIKKQPDGTYTLEDNSSKFGTLLLIQYPIRLEPSRNYFFQSGKSMLTMRVRQQKSCMKCCQKLSEYDHSSAMTTFDGSHYFPKVFMGENTKDLLFVPSDHQTNQYLESVPNQDANRTQEQEQNEQQDGDQVDVEMLEQLAGLASPLCEEGRTQVEGQDREGNNGPLMAGGIESRADNEESPEQDEDSFEEQKLESEQNRGQEEIFTGRVADVEISDRQTMGSREHETREKKKKDFNVRQAEGDLGSD